MTDTRLWRLIVIVTILGIGHHVDHVIRGNHVGWPLIPEVTGFTYSLAFYPLIAVGVYLTLRGLVAAGFWGVLAGTGFVFVLLTHFGPWALEPVQDILGPYRSPWVGWVAVGWLVVFLTVLGATAVYATYRWVKRQLLENNRYGHQRGAV